MRRDFPRAIGLALVIVTALLIPTKSAGREAQEPQPPSPRPLLARTSEAHAAAVAALEERAPNEWLIYSTVLRVLSASRSAMEAAAPEEWEEYLEATKNLKPWEGVRTTEASVVRVRTTLRQAAPDAFDAFERTTVAMNGAQNLLDDVAPSEFAAFEAIAIAATAAKILDDLARRRNGRDH